MFSGNARSPQTEQADQKPERFYDKRRQIEFETKDTIISSAPAAFRSEYLGDELGSLSSWRSNMGNYDQQNTNESFKIEQVEVHSYHHRLCEAV